MNRKNFPRFLIILILFIGFMDTIADMFSWYWRIPWLDMPMHFLGGFWVGSVALWFFVQNNVNIKYLYIFFISIGVVLVVGSIWEIFGFNPDAVISVKDEILDTSSDVFFDILGGVIASLYFIIKK